MMTLKQAIYLANNKGTMLFRFCDLDGVEFGARAQQIIDNIESALPVREERSFDTIDLVEALYLRGPGRWYRRDILR